MPAPAATTTPSPVPAGARPVDPAATRHGPIAQLLIAWSPLSAVLVSYWVASWITAPLGTGEGATTNRLGLGLDLSGLARADQAVFGVVPSVWLQRHLADGDPRWYDAVAALVYVTHFVSLPLVTAVVWFGLRERFRAWVAAVLALTLLGITGYVVHPAAPPWLVSERGLTGPVQRISNLGWDQVGLPWVGSLTELGQEASNPVAAMPSLHAGVALLVALFLWSAAGRAGRVALTCYAAAMALTLVYTGEHFVVDVAAGWLVAAVAALVGATVQHRRTAGQAEALIGDDPPGGAPPSRGLCGGRSRR
jgi:membrane-associated phospholipid phosphatase